MRTIWVLWVDYGDQVGRMIFAFTEKHLAERQKESYERVAQRAGKNTSYWVSEELLFDKVQP